MTPVHSDQVKRFRALHESGCFVMPNPWDIGSAKLLHHLGFSALATTSAGYAFSQGLPDSTAALSRDNVLHHTKEIVDASPLPVNADFQSGYADDPEGVAKNVTLCIQTGVAGLSIEDATGNKANPLYERSLAIERIRAARLAVDATGTGVILTARCEACLFNVPDWETIIFDRLVAFADAGADCLFAPGIKDPDMIASLVKAVAPKPVNVLVSAPVPGLSVSLLTGLGVRRISVGSALTRVAWGAMMQAAESILKTGEFTVLGNAVSFATLNTIYSNFK